MESVIYRLRTGWESEMGSTIPGVVEISLGIRKRHVGKTMDGKGS